MKDKARVYRVGSPHREIGEHELLALAQRNGYQGDDLTSAYQHAVYRGVEVRFLEYRDAELAPNGVTERR